MEKKYQVFVSSTYEDLIEERKEVIQALLELDCFPVGMEMFPAADEEQWTVIKRLIDECDYYILIIAGRYGSLGKDGLSYTQMEYEYATLKGVPTISFTHKSPGNIVTDKTEKVAESIPKLENFRNLVKTKMCKTWETPSELGSVVSRSLVNLKRDRPRTGWVKASLISTEEITRELLDLKKENEKLQKAILNLKDFVPEGSENLSQGEDEISIWYSYLVKESMAVSRHENAKISITWNVLFKEISPAMIDEADEETLKRTLDKFCYKTADPRFLSLSTKNKLPSLSQTNLEYEQFLLDDKSWEVIKVQFKALGLMTMSTKKRSTKDMLTYWTLTPLGDSTMTRLIAIEKKY